MRDLNITTAAGAAMLRSRLEEAHMRPLQWPIVKRTLSYIGPYKRTFILGIACTMVIHLIELVPPWLVRQAVDVNMKQNDLHGLMVTAMGFVVTSAAFFLGAAAVHWFIRYSAEKALRDMRRDVFNKIQTLDMGYFDRVPAGRLITRGHSDLMVMGRLVMHILPMVISSVVTLVGSFVMMARMDWRLFAIVLVAAPPLYLASSRFRQRARPAWRRVRRDVSRLTANVAEMVSGVRVVQAFTREEENLDRFDEMNMVFWRSNMRVARYQGWYLLIVEGLAVVCLAALLGGGGWFMMQAAGVGGAVEVGTLMAFFLYAQRTFEPIRRMAPTYNHILHAMASGERVFGLLDYPPRITDAPDATDLVRVEGHVKFDHVNFEYIAGQPVLHDICFEVPPGQTIALVGHTGCGKTTIVSLLNRFYDVTSGAITVDGQDVRSVTQQSLHNQTGLILQESFLFNATVMQNLKYARPDVSDDEVIEICRQLGCHDIFARLPEGYETQVGERGENLSAGQRQLVSIARAMVDSPRVLMLDEATSSVDTQTERAIQYAIDVLLEKRTCFIVAHRLSTVRRADQILVLDHGHIVERGTHDQLVDFGGVYAELHRQFMKVEDAEAEPAGEATGGE